jgi:glutamine cyclotransferase
VAEFRSPSRNLVCRLRVLLIVLFTGLICPPSLCSEQGNTFRPEGLHAGGKVWQTGTSPAGSAHYDIKIVRTYAHDPEAFTQGLVFSDGFLYESTGLYGSSSLRKVELETGKVLKIQALPKDSFGEGLTLWRGNLIQLTWRSGIGFVYDRDSFRKVGEFQYRTEGWGITHDGKSFIMSDGSAVLRFLDPYSYHEERRVVVLDEGVPIRNLNALEYIKGEVFANVWQKDAIVRISPTTGKVLGWVDLSKLRNALGPVRGAEVLNGIAYDAANDRIFITGKLWPKLFEIKLILR